MQVQLDADMVGMVRQDQMQSSKGSWQVKAVELVSKATGTVALTLPSCEHTCIRKKKLILFLLIPFLPSK